MTAAERFREEGREEERRKLRNVAEKLREEVRNEERRKILFRLLTLRFGDLPAEVTSRIQHATLEQLEIWIERVLTAHSVTEVLDA